MSSDPTCPDCREPMELGFIPDASYAVVVQTHWHPGTPKDAPRFLGSSRGKEVDRRRMLPVHAWRCPECGLLRILAPRQDPRIPGGEQPL